MSNKKFGAGANGKGYYIALILCAVAIGISGYLYYYNANDSQPDQPDAAQVGATLDAGSVSGSEATQPTQTGSEPTQPTQSTQPTVPVTRKRIQTVAPVAGETVAVYAMESLSYNQTTRDWRVHNGVDIAAEAGTQVCAAADGTVYTVYEDETMGTTVVIRHDEGYVTRYSSLAAEVSVEPGDTVARGQAIGCVGKTAILETAIGDHLHFSVTWNDEPMDPAEFLSN